MKNQIYLQSVNILFRLKKSPNKYQMKYDILSDIPMNITKLIDKLCNKNA